MSAPASIRVRFEEVAGQASDGLDEVARARLVAGILLSARRRQLAPPRNQPRPEPDPPPKAA